MKLPNWLKEAWKRASNTKMSFGDLARGRTGAWHYDPPKTPAPARDEPPAPKSDK